MSIKAVDNPASPGSCSFDNIFWQEAPRETRCSAAWWASLLCTSKQKRTLRGGEAFPAYIITGPGPNFLSIWKSWKLHGDPMLIEDSRVRIWKSRWEAQNQVAVAGTTGLKSQPKRSGAIRYKPHTPFLPDEALRLNGNRVSQLFVSVSAVRPKRNAFSLHLAPVRVACWGCSGASPWYTALVTWIAIERMSRKPGGRALERIV